MYIRTVKDIHFPVDANSTMTQQVRKKNEVSLLVILLISCITFAVARASSNKDLNAKEHEGTKNDPVLQKRNAKTEYPDQLMAETGHIHKAGGGGDPSRGAKYFMYAHQPDKKQYEFGYKRGTGEHSIERYEKAGPNHNFKTKVRWQDGKNGHGEHYWDYNHTPKHEHHDGGHGKGDHGHSHGGDGHHSEPVPEYVEAESQKATVQSVIDDMDDSMYEASDSMKSTEILKRAGLEKTSNLPEKNPPSTVNDLTTNAPSAFPTILGFDPYTPPAMARSRSKFPKKMKTQPMPTEDETESKSTELVKPDIKDDSNIPKLAYDIDTGRVYDEKSNIWFDLVPVKI